MVTPKLWYTATWCSPSQGWWINAMHRAQWSHCPMCGVCQRRCIASSPHWVSRSPAFPTQHSDAFWWDQRFTLLRENWWVLSTRSAVLDGPATFLRADEQVSKPMAEWAQAGSGVRRGSHLCIGRVRLGGTLPGGLGQGYVLDNQPHHHQRLILESIHIRSQTRPLNRDRISMPQIYNSLFFK